MRVLTWLVWCCLCSGALGAAEALPGLEAGADPAVAALSVSRAAREQAYSELARNPERAKPLADAWGVAKDPRQRAAAVRIATAISGAKALPALATLVQDKEAVVRRAVAEAVAALDFPGEKDRNGRAMLELLARVLGDRDVQARLIAARKLGDCPCAAATRLLLAAATDSPEAVAELAVDGLKKQKVPKLVEQIAPHLNDSQARPRVLAANALGALGGTAAVTKLLGGLDAAGSSAQTWEVRAAICDAIAAIAPDEAPVVAKVEKALLPLLADQKWGVRCSAAWALGRIGSKNAVPALMAAGDPLDSEPFHSVLRGLSDQPWTKVDEWRTWWKKEGKGFQPHALPPPPTESTLSFWSIEDKTTNVVFVIDHSGSMAETGLISQYHQKDKDPRSKLEIAKRELLRTALTLNPGTRLNVVLFNAEVQTWNEGPLRATWRVKAKLKEWLDGDQVSAGGATDASDALATGIEQWEIETLFFLTDGMPTAGEMDTSRIVSDISERNAGLSKPARVHTIAFFVEQAGPFLSRLAEKNSGLYRLEQ